MADMNNCSFTGRLTADAVKKVLPTGTDLVEFSLANNTGWGGNEKTLFMTVNLWGKMGTGVYQYLLKGKAVGITGTLEQQKWDDREGNHHSKIVLNCSNLTLLGGNTAEQAPMPPPSMTGTGHTTKDAIDAETDFTQDIPF